MRYLQYTIVILLAFVLLYTRFINLGWGRPFPFHPDENNMAAAIIQLHCDQPFSPSGSHECFNPHFYAYGQFPLYLAYAGIQLFHLFTPELTVTFSSAVLALRTISASASVLTALLIIAICWHFFGYYRFPEKKRVPFLIGTSLLAIFSPGLIQFAHFGTTESLLMFFFTGIVYLSILYTDKKLSLPLFFAGTSLLAGLAMATKVSSFVFAFVPVVLFIRESVSLSPEKIGSGFFTSVRWTFITLLLFIIFSPYNFIDFGDFLGSMHYESSVGLGTLPVFYTRQFFMTIPVVFQFLHIFPFTLGWLVFIFSIIGIFFLPKNRSMNIFRFAWLVFFLSNAFLYTKWTRFMAPLFPLMVISASLTLVKLWSGVTTRVKNRHSAGYEALSQYVMYLVIIICCLPGIAILSIYSKQDVRVQASNWIFEHVPSGSRILSEGGNVVDIPISDSITFLGMRPQYNIFSFDFYQVDQDPAMQNQLMEYIGLADYIIVPSRRVFANQSCDFPDDYRRSLSFDILSRKRCQAINTSYPVSHEYFSRLFGGNLQFEKVAEFDSFPTISIGAYKWVLPDEQAEETWSVFDHPVIRIYKKIKSRQYATLQQGS